MSKRGFEYSAEVVERLFPKNPKFLEIGNQVYISHLQQTGEYQTGPDCQTFYQSPNIHRVTVFQIFTDNSRSASTPSDIHNLVSISETFSAQFLLIKSLIIA